MKIVNLLKKKSNLALVILIFVLQYVLIFKLKPVAFDFAFLLYNVLFLLIALNLVCFINDFKIILKNKKSKKGFLGFLSFLFYLFMLPFSQACIAGVCSAAVLLGLSAFLPSFLVFFVHKYLELFLIVALSLNVLTLFFLGCFKKEKVFFKTKLDYL